MRCLYCGKEYWLPSQVRRDPDFCTPDHRREYNNRVELGMRRILESSTPALPKRVPEPAVQIPARRAPAGETRSVPYPRITPSAPSHLPVNLVSGPVSEPSEAAPLATNAEEADRFDTPVNNTPPAPAQATPETPEVNHQRAQKHDDQEPVFRGMIGMLETAATDRYRARRFATMAIAASVAVVMVVWIGAHVVQFGRSLLNRGASMMASSHTPLIPRGRPEAAATVTSGRPEEPNALHHVLDWAQSAATQRATTHLAENFETGMAAWGRTSNAWSPGWSRSRDGYVRPGQLALFQPTLGYTDYRVDFFGQIESKSLSWVVRGKDARNYYAMELKLKRAGLRPVLSMVHYPVIDGIRGHAVEMPLSVMVPNDAPYHVSVEVKGSHYTASFEGEEIDSWSDDTLLAGGVGFFSEPGARARIYWMNVSRNDDWFGWLCGQIAATAGGGDIAPVSQPGHTVAGRTKVGAKNFEIGIISN